MVVRVVFIDGVQMAAQSEPRSAQCSEGCPVTFVAVSDPVRPFPLPLHHLLIMPGIVSPAAVQPASFAPLVHRAENMRWVEVSSGPDGVDVTWDTVGFEASIHEQVKVTLDTTGGLTATTQNFSSHMWNQVVPSAGRVVADTEGARNWTTAELNTSGIGGFRIRYLDSDPCFDVRRPTKLSCGPRDCVFRSTHSG